MAESPGWYPPGQVCYPPELPTYLKNVYELKPIIGVPSDDEVTGIHAVLQAARKASEIPGMHDSGLLMGLADHLFGAQLARYRSKYSLITFPSDATYTPPSLPAHISVKLEPISGAPTDEEMTRAQDALRSYQQFNHAPSMFDAHVNMELSQHLFDLQMEIARYMRRAGETQPSLETPAITTPDGPVQSVEASLNTPEEMITTTNNLGMGANATGLPGTPHLASAIDVRELMERSNQLADRFNQLMERSNELVERCCQPNDQSSSLAERFNQMFERFTQFVEQTRQPSAQSDQLAERFNQLLERFNQLAEKSGQSTDRSNELTERSNGLTERANQLAEQATKPVEMTADLLKNINKVLVGIQHAIVRNHKGNTLYAADCLVNEKGQTPREGLGRRFSWEFELTSRTNDNRLPVQIGGTPQISFMMDLWLGGYLRFYGIGESLRENASSTILKAGKEREAREMLSDYLSSCLG